MDDDILIAGGGLNGVTMALALASSGFQVTLADPVPAGLQAADDFDGRGDALAISSVAEPYIRGRALRHLEKGRVVIFVGGTGNPFFTTDSAAALRASEIGADAVLKATKVDGIYDKDPNKFEDAVRYETLTFDEAIEKQLAVMDLTAFAMCRERSIPIIVFDMKTPGHIAEVVAGTPHGTRVSA